MKSISLIILSIFIIGCSASSNSENIISPADYTTEFIKKFSVKYLPIVGAYYPTDNTHWIFLDSSTIINTKIQNGHMVFELQNPNAKNNEIQSIVSDYDLSPNYVVTSSSTADFNVVITAASGESFKKEIEIQIIDKEFYLDKVKIGIFQESIEEINLIDLIKGKVFYRRIVTMHGYDNYSLSYIKFAHVDENGNFGYYKFQTELPPDRALYDYYGKPAELRYSTNDQYLQLTDKYDKIFHLDSSGSARISLVALDEERDRHTEIKFSSMVLMTHQFTIKAKNGEPIFLKNTTYTEDREGYLWIISYRDLYGRSSIIKLYQSKSNPNEWADFGKIFCSTEYEKDGVIIKFDHLPHQI